MNTREFEYFIAIAKTGNMHTAASELFISQSALSQYVSKLEDRLEVQLFIRAKNREMQLTQAGQQYLLCCENMLKIWTETERNLQLYKKKTALHFSIGVPSQRAIATLSSCLEKISARFPDPEIEIFSAPHAALQQRLISGKLDIVFCPYKEKNTAIDYIPLCRREVELYVPAEHPLARYSYVHPSQKKTRIDIALAEEQPFVLLNGDTVLRQVQDEYFKSRNFHPLVKTSVPHIESVASFIQDHRYLSLLPHASSLPSGVFPIALLEAPQYLNGALLRRGTRAPVIWKEIIKEFQNEFFKRIS